MSYKNLEVWKLARELSIEIHEMILGLPDSEKYEEGQQIRKSIKTVRSTLAEGYGRRQYKLDYIKFIIYALSSNDETIDHLETLYETKSLKSKELYERLHDKLEVLGKKLNNFLKAVQDQHNEPRSSRDLHEPETDYPSFRVVKPESSILRSSINRPQSDSPSQNPWKTLSSEEKYDNPWISVTEYKVTNPAGKPGIYGKVHFKNKAVGVVPLDNQRNTWLVGQYRYPLNEWSWEIPEGGSPISAHILESAKRELQEETGLTAGRWTQLLRTHLTNSVSDEEGFVFLAEDLLEGVIHREDTEADMKVWKLPFMEALQMVLDGKITDGLSVMGILRVGRVLGI